MKIHKSVIFILCIILLCSTFLNGCFTSIKTTNVENYNSDRNMQISPGELHNVVLAYILDNNLLDSISVDENLIDIEDILNVFENVENYLKEQYPEIVLDEDYEYEKLIMEIGITSYKEGKYFFKLLTHDEIASLFIDLKDYFNKNETALISSFYDCVYDQDFETLFLNIELIYPTIKGKEEYYPILTLLCDYVEYSSLYWSEYFNEDKATAVQGLIFIAVDAVTGAIAGGVAGSISGNVIVGFIASTVIGGGCSAIYKKLVEK